MFKRNLCASLVAASLVAVPVQRAQADEAAALIGGLILGGVIANEVAKNKQRRTSTSSTTRRSSGISSAQREENRSVQRALNYFGYNVGAADGSIGRKTRAGIARYQADMGFNPDGAIDAYERDFLLTSHQRALASSHVAPYNQVIATQGTTGLLRTYRNEQLGIATPGLQQQQPAPVQASTQPVPQPAPQAVTRTQPAPATLPVFPTGAAATSISERCNEINVLTAANGGITPASRVTDAEFALNEQFCLARTHLMAESTAIVSTIANMTDAQIQTQCDGLSQVMAEQIAGIEGKQANAVISQTAAFLQGTGRPIDQLMSGGKICLGVGYRIDNPEMAMGSAVLLAAGGEQGYGEIVGHHLREGFGVPRAPMGTSAAWMQIGIDAAERMGKPMTGQTPERLAVLKTAMRGGAPSSSTATLPVFPTGN